MKRFLLALCVLLGATTAFAQTEPVTFRPLTGFNVTALTTGGTTSSKAFESQTRWARFLCNVDCRIAVMVTPIVAGASVPVFLPASVPEYFIVAPGQFVRVQSDSATGTLFVTEMGR